MGGGRRYRHGVASTNSAPKTLRRLPTGSTRLGPRVGRNVWGSMKGTPNPPPSVGKDPLHVGAGEHLLRVRHPGCWSSRQGPPHRPRRWGADAPRPRRRTQRARLRDGGREALTLKVLLVTGGTRPCRGHVARTYVGELGRAEKVGGIELYVSLVAQLVQKGHAHAGSGVDERAQLGVEHVEVDFLVVLAALTMDSWRQRAHIPRDHARVGVLRVAMDLVLDHVEGVVDGILVLGIGLQDRPSATTSRTGVRENRSASLLAWEMKTLLPEPVACSRSSMRISTRAHRAGHVKAERLVLLLGRHVVEDLLAGAALVRVDDAADAPAR